jgi:DNA primase
MMREDQKELVQQATDIVDLVGQQLALKPKGREFVALCPFHDDHRPSMAVVPSKQIFKCFVCGAGGDVFSWMMRYHQMTFPEALKFLAERAGIKLETKRPGPSMSGPAEDSDQPSDKERLSQANRQAIEYFQRQLADPKVGLIARGYVTKRGINAAMIEAFQIGYAPDEWDALTKHIEAKRWDRQAFELAGLISPRSGGDGFFDKLRHRLIFPICDGLGRPIAFGGRVLPDSKREDRSDAKYLNSPETLLFHKSSTLYGLHLAKKSIIDSRTAVIVEGYTDVIACHQAGATNAVATLGTALTPQHAAQLRRFADRVVLVFDGDEAGQKAADRATEVFMTGGLDVGIAVLPGGKDPDELLASPDGKAVWDKLIDQADDALLFQFEKIRGEIEAERTVSGKQRMIEEYMRRMATAGFHQVEQTRRGLIVKKLAGMVRMSEDAVTRMFRQMTPNRPKREVAPDSGSDTGDADVQVAQNNSASDVARPQIGPKLKALEHAERLVIGCLLREPELFGMTLRSGHELTEDLMPAEFVTASGQRLYHYVHQRWSDFGRFSLAALLAELAVVGEEELIGLATTYESQAEQITKGDPEALREVLQNSAEMILLHHREVELQQPREEQNATAVSDTEDPITADIKLQRLKEHRKAHPAPAKIAKLGS